MTPELAKQVINNVRRKTGKAIKHYGLIQADDRILVGLSGGKDSLALLDTLAYHKKRFPHTFRLFAIHVQMTAIPDNTDIAWLAGFCRQLDVPFIHKQVDILPDKAKKRSECFVCSWHRRKTMFAAREELGCNKLALGHHLDDAIETLLMNMMYHGSISSLPAKLRMFEGDMELIRPLILLPEKELADYALARGFLTSERKCPFEDKTKRNTVKHIICEMESHSKNARINVFRSMRRIFGEYLP